MLLMLRNIIKKGHFLEAVMKKIYVLISLLFIFTGLLPADNNAVLKISALSGEVDCSLAGADWKPAVLNQALRTSDKIRTRNGRAELLFPEGTTIRIKESSLLDLVNIQCAAEKQNSSFKLFFGELKAKVTKLKDGGSFVIATPKIVAAVKGTEFILGTTNETSDLQVLEGIVALHDLLREKEIFVRENEKANYRDGLLGDPRNMEPGEIQGFRAGYELASLRNERSRSLAPGNDTDAETKEMKDLRNDLAEVKDRSNLEDKQDLLERISDVQMGKTAIDMHGYRVRTDNYVLRPLPNILQLLNITKREGGPDSGISSFEINDTFNKNLPDNYMDVRIALHNNASWFNSGTAPEYWLLQETSAIRNPHGDVIFDNVILNTPQWNSTLSTPMWEQPFKEDFSINGNYKWTHKYDYNFTNGNFSEYYINNATTPVTTYSTATNPLPYTVSDPVKTADGGILFKDTYGDNTWLEKYVYLINDAGVVQPLADIGKPTLNWEMIYRAPEFGSNSIDLIVLPEIFNELY